MGRLLARGAARPKRAGESVAAASPPGTAWSRDRTRRRPAAVLAFLLFALPAAAQGWRRDAAPPAGQTWRCGEKTYCTQMTSCAEAMFHFRACGLARLDGDRDGVPCERLCGRGGSRRRR